MAGDSPSQIWSRLNGARSDVLAKAERYASLTIPKLCVPSGTTEATSKSQDYQALGAAAVNYLNNRLMLTLFRPGDPFFRMDPGQRTKAMLQQLNMTEQDLGVLLAQKELDAVSVLDNRAIRPKLYQCGRHLIALGNVLLELGKEVRVYGLRSYCVKRMTDGTPHTIVIREKVKFDELDPEAQAEVKNKNADTMVNYYRVIERKPAGNYVMRQAVDETVLQAAKFQGRWSNVDALPFHPLTWDLADEDDYGTGLVEDFEGDFEALSALSESLLDGAVLTTEMRWLLNSAGIATVDDFKKSINGDVIPGQKGDLEAIFGGSPQAIEVCIKVVELYSQRIARGFLMQSSMVRNAERVTAEEIRAIAMELETAFGGVYSQLGINFQKPIAMWCLADVDMQVKGTDLRVTVITGLEALSRNAQLEKLRAALGDLALFEGLPDSLRARMNWQAVAAFVGQGRGINLIPFMKTDEQFRKDQEQAMADQATTAAGVAAGEAAAQSGAAQQGMQPA